MTQNEIHDLVWKRFIRMPYGHLLDYADENGNTTIPTPEECEASDPNPMGWWTPIENGSFFGGLYLVALIERYNQKPDTKTADCISALAKGLMLNQDVAHTEGFIARGVATDGKSHYVFSSGDQVFPWVLGMLAYMDSALCTDPENIRVRILRILRALKKNGGAIPCDTPYPCIGNPTLDRTDWRETISTLFCAYALYQLSGNEDDLVFYRTLRDGKPTGCDETRIEIAAHGFAPDMVHCTDLIQFWIFTAYHLAQRKLAGLDNECAALYAQGCRFNAITALPFAENFFLYDNRAGDFDLNWRALAPTVIPFTGDLAEAYKNASRQCGIWMKQIARHRPMEHMTLGNAVFGLWIALTAGDRRLEEIARKKMACMDQIDWNTLTVCYAFAAESCMIFAGKE